MANTCSLIQSPALGSWEPTLFDAGPTAPSFTNARRIDLGADAWLDVVPGFLTGAAAPFDELVRTIAWREQERPMYERIVRVPRLMGKPERPLPPGIAAARAALNARYALRFHHVSCALYRDGHDSVAPHGDRVGKTQRNAVVAVLSLGVPRRFRVTPVAGGIGFATTVRSGDLLVMGSACQHTHRHAVPKQSHAGPRMAVMFRHGEVPEN
jgi:alkylated DNA repair dioxygenase AlkB